MRVIHVITRLIVGGAQENTVASVLGLRRCAGLEVELVSGPTVGPEGSLEARVAAEPGCLTVLPDLIRPVRPGADWRAYRELRDLLRRRKPMMVHTHSGKAGVLGRLAARRAGVPLIVHTIHGPSFGPFQGPLANAVFRTAERLAGRVTDHFVVVAEAMTRQYLAAGIGSPAQYTRIFSGFDLEPFLQTSRKPELASRLGLQPGDFVVGKIARLFELKGHDDLFAVAPALVRRIPRIKFLLVGDGAWRERFEAMASTPELRGHFVFAGLVPPEAVPDYVGCMDVLVHLSRREGLPRALPQALAAGRPVVAFDCDGAGEVCRDGETGYLIPVGDRVRLEQRLVELAGDPELRHRLGDQGRRFVADRFSVSAMVDALRALYLKLAQERGMAPADSGTR
jgi:glycosyltransferase involved in cell wall biosynthesis